MRFFSLTLSICEKSPECSCFCSQAVIADRTMYISGQIGLDVKTGTIVEGGAVAEAEQVKFLMHK